MSAKAVLTTNAGIPVANNQNSVTAGPRGPVLLQAFNRERIPERVRGDFPKWDVSVQMMTEDQAHQHPDTPFDITKVWSYKDFPRIPVGVLELNRNPENYHAEVEQAAFSPANVVPGLGFSPDKMLQGRLFGYHDAQLYRVGTNHQHLPVNKPRCPMYNFQRDGPADAKDRLTSNIVGAMGSVSDEFKQRQIAHFLKADLAYGKSVAEKLGMKIGGVAEVAEALAAE